MTLQQQLHDNVHRMKTHFDRTTSVFDEADSNFAPSPGTFTTAQVIAHVAQTVDWFVEAVFIRPDGYDMDFETMDKQIRQVTSLAAARRWLERSCGRAAQLALNATDEQLNTGITVPDPILDGAPRSVAYWAMEDHTAHHRGALTVYARLLGKVSPMPYFAEGEGELAPQN
jgi:uncharacterized damage-inducible protein DinB